MFVFVLENVQNYQIIIKTIYSSILDPNSLFRFFFFVFENIFRFGVKLIVVKQIKYILT